MSGQVGKQQTAQAVQRLVLRVRRGDLHPSEAYADIRDIFQIAFPQLLPSASITGCGLTQGKGAEDSTVRFCLWAGGSNNQATMVTAERTLSTGCTVTLALHGNEEADYVADPAAETLLHVVADLMQAVTAAWLARTADRQLHLVESFYRADSDSPKSLVDALAEVIPGAQITFCREDTAGKMRWLAASHVSSGVAEDYREASEATAAWLRNEAREVDKSQRSLLGIAVREHGLRLCRLLRPVDENEFSTETIPESRGSVPTEFRRPDHGDSTAAVDWMDLRNVCRASAGVGFDSNGVVCVVLIEHFRHRGPKAEPGPDWKTSESASAETETTDLGGGSAEEALLLQTAFDQWGLTEPQLNRSPLKKRIVTALVVLFFLLFPVPWRMNVGATLRPINEVTLYASADSVVDEVRVAPGARVDPGQTLLQLHSESLEAEEIRFSAEIQVWESRIREAQLDGGGGADSGLETVARLRRDAARRQLELNIEEQSHLQVRAPTGGFLHYDGSERMEAGRPVRRGQPLAHLADVEGEWIAVLEIPPGERALLGTLETSLVSVDLRVADEPNFRSTIARVDSFVQTEGRREFCRGESLIGDYACEIRRPGMPAEASLLLGYRPLGYLILRPLYGELRWWWMR